MRVRRIRKVLSHFAADVTLLYRSDTFDLTALSVAQLYKERWKIENWWKWLKAMYKIKEPMSRSATALPVPNRRRVCD
ncbi:MAG: transposase [Pyrinomonadaceae bacterium]|nr:transposase [Pyrinomonadaceae bacterium]